MAIVRLDFRQMLRILRVLGTFTNTWPPSLNAGRNYLLFRDLYYNFIFFIVLSGWLPMVIGTYKNREDFAELMKNISHVGAITEAFLNIFLCRINRKRLQSLLMSIEEFVNVSKDRERVILQKYVDRYITFFSFVGVMFVMAGITAMCCPLFMPLEFFIQIWYPFSTKPLSRKIIIYIIQIFMSMQTIFCFNVDVMIAVFLFYSSARLEILAYEIQQATDEASIVSCIKKHQEILKFVSETQNASRYILFKTTVTMGFTIFSGIFPLLYVRSLVLIPQYLSMTIAALQRMYITAWSAEDLKEASIRFAWSVYNTSWLGKSQKMKSDLFMMLQRSQKPVLIFMGGLLPALTLEYCANFVTSVMSYFTAMRAAINK